MTCDDCLLCVRRCVGPARVSKYRAEIEVIVRGYLTGRFSPRSHSLVVFILSFHLGRI
ncbi:hypothetical protein M378DRAFT_796547 [Amanita muscaria Koide BX008]|uniref:Uncharacterized protein n=1 Tax=Amanita muscaria (strain Koide BX008) TaxID=946122 RepID=A0A0C2WZQ1_AMAMK|nr:hypothetical protein M378DRAFT_796547 [Amanita muscaria Koide BX008]